MADETQVEVAALAPVPGLLTYRLPPELVGLVRRGCRVLVPLGGKRRVLGVVVAVGTRGGLREEAKPVDDLLDLEPVLDGDVLDLVEWMASYYQVAPGEAMRVALPAALQARERQLVRLTPEGSRVLAAQQAVLRSSDDDLSVREHEILDQLGRARGKSLSLRSLAARGRVGRALGELVRRGLVAQSARRQDETRRRMDLLLELCEPHDPPRLERARRQAGLVEALRAAGGRARLGQLPRGSRALAYLLAKKGIVRLEEVEVPRDPFAAEPVEVERPITLTAEQEAALGPLLAAARAHAFAAFLLHGVTGSGKTEIYLRTIAELLSRGRGAIVLVPEISLTPQLAARFRARFGNQVAVLHSALTDAERYGQWRLIRSGQVRIVVGARSALFAPVKDLGIVAVDEEHDHSFKQEEGVRYNARDLALVRAKRCRALAILGSATPSLESYHGAQTGRLRLLELRRRATPRPLPEVEIVDLRRYHTGPEGFLSAPLSAALAGVLAEREQAILFLNRRGFSTFLLCRSCGHVFRCTNCSVSLTYHRGLDRLVCHYCGYATRVPGLCPACEGEAVVHMGLGTEQVEQGLSERFPQARVARLDRDTAGTQGMRKILAQVSRREVDILVGTQMVTKGHDFPHVTLVGVIAADLGLHFPDFRAAERTFQLLTQVAGRAGRGERPGRVVIQTYDPEHPSLRCARTHDYLAFYGQEVESRRELLYPPWGHLAAVRVDGRDAGVVERAARELADRGRRRVSRETQVRILGPTEAPIQRLKGRTRWLLLLKGSERSALRRVLEQMRAEPLRARAVRVSVDMDPLMML